MEKEKRPVGLWLIFAAVVLFIILLMQPLEVLHYLGDIDFLFPKGSVAIKERNLLFIIQTLMLLVVIPVYILTFIFAWKYRAENPKGKYTPDLQDNVLAEFIWWGVPCLLILVMGTLTWIRTYELDPFKPLESDKKPVTIQVVALQWKWLFIYPEEKIATVNFIQIPKRTPINFQITADAPMNSFWIPKLGSQIYAMPNMKTQLNLIADYEGEFNGASANISGKGFAGMTFLVRSSNEEEYQKWISTVKQSPQSLSIESYEELAKPSEYHPVTLFSLKDEKLFDYVLMKYMHPHKGEH